MTTKRKKQQHQSALDAMQAAMKDHPWPDEIALPVDHEKCISIYRKVVQNRAHDSWFPADLLEVARYCRLLCDTEEVYAELVDEGWTALGGKSGNSVIENPLIRVHSNLSSQLNMIARRLNLATSYRESDNKSRETMDNRAGKEKEARKARDEVEAKDESLI